MPIGLAALLEDGIARRRVYVEGSCKVRQQAFQKNDAPIKVGKAASTTVRRANMAILQGKKGNIAVKGRPNVRRRVVAAAIRIEIITNVVFSARAAPLRKPNSGSFSAGEGGRQRSKVNFCVCFTIFHIRLAFAGIVRQNGEGQEELQENMLD